MQGDVGRNTPTNKKWIIFTERFSRKGGGNSLVEGPNYGGEGKGLMRLFQFENQAIQQGK